MTGLTDGCYFILSGEENEDYVLSVARVRFSGCYHTYKEEGGLCISFELWALGALVVTWAKGLGLDTWAKGEVWKRV